MTTLDFFRNIQREEPSYFDEGPKIVQKIAVAINTGSIDTSAFDGHRQGVELTQQKHFDAGIVKIHAGEPGHVLRRNRYGMDRNYRNDPRFEDIDYFNPENYIRAQENGSPILINIITFPIITSNNDQIENYVFDGVIEPLTIRPVASFFSTEVPFESHQVRGAVMAGNTDMSWASDIIQTVYANDLRSKGAYVDMYVDTLAFPELITTESHVATNFGLFDVVQPVTSPFFDIRYPRNTTLSSNYDSQLDAALSLMSGSTDNYIDQTLRMRSAATGWDYDTNAELGTDTLAFGGMVY